LYAVIEKSAFTTTLFLSLIAEYGCVLARGLFPMSDVLTLRTNAEAIYRDYDRGLSEALAGRPPESSPHITADSFATDFCAMARFRQFGDIATQTINCWIALDPCGVDAPAMEVYPHRMPELMKAGDSDAIVPWEISEQMVYARLGKENFWTPEFAPGDAFIFDHMHLHRTHLTSRMTRDRFAMENWMFPITEPYRDRVLAWLG
jgi:hypothetical protein